MKLICSLYLILFFGQSALAQNKEITQFQLIEDSEAMGLLISADYYNYDLDSINLSSSGLGFGIEIPIRSWLNLGILSQQAFSSQDNFATLFTTFAFRAQFALSGNFKHADHEFISNSRRYLKFESHNPGGFRAAIGMKQSSFNTSESAVPYSGFGGQLAYDFPQWGSTVYRIGIDFDRLTNSANIITSRRAFLETKILL